MDAEDVVLGIVSAFDGEVPGRTYLQKVAYFVGRKLGLRLGFSPHYYGPYSRVITAETEAQVAAGRLSEESATFAGSGAGAGPFERVRCTYSLTEGGQRYLDHVRALDDGELEALVQTVNRIRETQANYQQLSCAAKLDYLLEEAGGRISREAAVSEAKKLGWDITQVDIDAAIRVLQRLDLVR